MDLKYDGHVKQEIIVNKWNNKKTKTICFFLFEDVLPIFIGKMYINSLIDLTRITSNGSKPMIVDELNDFVDYGRWYFNITSYYEFKFL